MSGAQVKVAPVALRFPGPARWTGPDTVDLHPHDNGWVRGDRAHQLDRLPARDCQIRGGEYAETALYFGSLDSGRDGYKVVWKNHPGEKPVSISGKDIRKALTEGREVDPRIMRPTTAHILAAAMREQP